MKWILGTLAILILGLVLKLSFLVYAMYVLLGILLLSRFFTRAWTEKLEVGRQATGEIFQIGESINVAVQVQNRGSLAVPWLIMEDSLAYATMTNQSQRVKVDGARLQLVRLKPGEMAKLEYSVEFLTRGYYQLGPVLLETGDVFGLHRRFRVASEPHFALVLPKVLEL